MIEQGQEWERLPFEHSRCYQAFAVYRDMGPERSLEKVSRELSKSVPLLKRWSAKWQWVKRAAAFDAYMERVKLKAQEDERREMGVRQAREGQTWQQFAMAGLQMWLNESGRPADKVPLSVLTRMMEIGVRVERLGKGESTDNVNQSDEMKVIMIPPRAKSEEEWLQRNEAENAKEL